MKPWSVCWRKLVMISISGLFVLTWRWWTFCWDNSLVSPSTHVFSACRIVGTVLSITRRRTGLCGKNWCLAKKGASSTTLWWTDRILFLPLHIKLCLIKPFTKALDKDGDCFTYLYQDFPGLTMEKLKAGIFDGLQIQQLTRDPESENSMNQVELEAWKAFVLVVKNFLGNNKARNYTELVNNVLTAFTNLSCNMNVKMHYLFSHMDRFPENLGLMGDEQGRDSIRTWKRWRPGIKVAGTHSWWLTTVGIWREHSRSSMKRKFKPWSLNNGEATCNLRVLTFINAHHSVYINRWFFYQVINICCW